MLIENEQVNVLYVSLMIYNMVIQNKGILHVYNLTLVKAVRMSFRSFGFCNNLFCIVNIIF